MRLKLIACEILYRECCAAVARSVNRVDLEFMSKGLHDAGQAAMSAKLSDALAAVDESQYDAVLLAYGLCSNGVLGLKTRSIPIVIPRAHDCITLFLGDKQRYLDYFHAHPGAYFQTTGWIERGQGLNQCTVDALQHLAGLGDSFQELVAKYGEDNAKFLHEQLGDLTKNYSAITWIDMGIEPNDSFERKARDQADERGWNFDKIAGSMSLIQELVDGDWSCERFLVVPPGQTIAPSYDQEIVKAE